MTDSGNIYHTCPLCRAGRLQPTRTPYVQVYEHTLVQVPGMASWKCDMCGLTVFDSDAVRRVETLIDADGLPPNRHLPLPGSALARDSVAPGDDLPEDIAPPAD